MTPEQRKRLDEDGYVMIKNAIEPIGLERVQKAYERIQSQTAQKWREDVKNGTAKGGYGHGPNAHTMSRVDEQDEVFLDLSANPKVMPLVEDIIGQPQSISVTAHCHHAGTKAHTNWHRDWPSWMHHKWIIKAKIFYFLDDQTEDMGCFSIVPGTHTLPDGPPKDQYRDDTLETMPNMKKVLGKAGDAILWNVLMWHTGTANTSNKDRRIIIGSYQPFWVKKWGSRTPPPVVVNWADTPQKRELQGIHAVGGRASWDRLDVPYLPEHEELVKQKKF
ncbi:MAG: hypothetical protein HOH77_17320 [Candidatus Latescibacteria bacterium]|jgi:ectoine hydroxylase-related dioxygenase (phytanoyl-CoA dioxygenase family)|nr:hypothetical protein [Candidatus Latescibacterota bacterium]